MKLPSFLASVSTNMRTWGGHAAKSGGQFTGGPRSCRFCACAVKQSNENKSNQSINQFISREISHKQDNARYTDIVYRSTRHTRLTSSIYSSLNNKETKAIHTKIGNLETLYKTRKINAFITVL